MLAIGAGGMDVAVAMGGGAYYITMPKMYQGQPHRHAAALRQRPRTSALSCCASCRSRAAWARSSSAAARASQTLSVPERATITNMGTELGATTSIFPSRRRDARLSRAPQGREEDFIPLASDPDARIRPRHRHRPQRAASRWSPARTARTTCVPVRSARGHEGRSGLHRLLHEFRLCSICSRSQRCSRARRYRPGREPVHLAGVEAGADHAGRLRRAHGHPRQRRAPARVRVRPVHRHGLLAQLRRRVACARSTATSTAAAARRTRRSTSCRPETAVASRAARARSPTRTTLGPMPAVTLPEQFLHRRQRRAAARPGGRGGRGGGAARAEHQALPAEQALCGHARAPSSCSRWATTSPPTTSCPRARRSCPTARTSRSCRSSASRSATRPSRRAPERPGTASSSAAANYGQGSSREHAALVPLYLGIRCVVAKSFARIHAANLINAGILPLTFENPDDYDALQPGAQLRIDGIRAGMAAGETDAHGHGGGQGLSPSCAASPSGSRPSCSPADCSTTQRSMQL